jgi:sulfur carrier protein
MDVLVNNQTQTTIKQASLTQLLQQLSLHEVKGMAVAVNNNIVPKSNWDKHMLTEHDKITIIRTTQGG